MSSHVIHDVDSPTFWFELIAIETGSGYLGGIETVAIFEVIPFPVAFVGQPREIVGSGFNEVIVSNQMITDYVIHCTYEPRIHTNTYNRCSKHRGSEWLYQQIACMVCLRSSCSAYVGGNSSLVVPGNTNKHYFHMASNNYACMMNKCVLSVRREEY